MYNKQDNLLKLQMLSFAMVDMALYVDAYPDSKEARTYRNQLLEMYNNERTMYEKEFGPLSICDGGDYERYVNDPWPWEVCR